MIDDVVGVFRLTQKASIANVTSIDVKAKGKVKETITNRKVVHGRFGVYKLWVRLKKKGRALFFGGSLNGMIHGQNCSGTESMRTLIHESLKFVEAALDAPLCELDRSRWLNGDITLLRVDIARMFDYGTEEQVDLVLDALRKQLTDRRASFYSEDTTVCCKNKQAPTQVNFYAKKPQMEKKRSLARALFRDELIKACEGKLRVEIRMKAAALREARLDQARSWKKTTAAEQFTRLLHKAPLAFAEYRLLNEFEMQKLDSGDRRAYELYLSGAEVQKLYSSAQFARHLNKFADMGINLRMRAPLPGRERFDLVSLKGRIEKDAFNKFHADRIEIRIEDPEAGVTSRNFQRAIHPFRPSQVKVAG
jgi:hypothetical protein